MEYLVAKDTDDYGRFTGIAVIKYDDDGNRWVLHGNEFKKVPDEEPINKTVGPTFRFSGMYEEELNLIKQALMDFLWEEKVRPSVFKRADQLRRLFGDIINEQLDKKVRT